MRGGEVLAVERGFPGAGKAGEDDAFGDRRNHKSIVRVSALAAHAMLPRSVGPQTRRGRPWSARIPVKRDRGPSKLGPCDSVRFFADIKPEALSIFQMFTEQ